MQNPECVFTAWPAHILRGVVPVSVGLDGIDHLLALPSSELRAEPFADALYVSTCRQRQDG
ncbi:hypothetical protein ABH926_005164 [Catenulispora sp. GP43]